MRRAIVAQSSRPREVRRRTVTHRPGKLSEWPATSSSPATVCGAPGRRAPCSSRRSGARRGGQLLVGPETGDAALVSAPGPPGQASSAGWAPRISRSPRAALPAGPGPAGGRGRGRRPRSPAQRPRRRRGVRRRRAAAAGGDRARPSRTRGPEGARARTAPKDGTAPPAVGSRRGASSGSTCTARSTTGASCAGGSRSAGRSAWCSSPFDHRVPDGLARALRDAPTHDGPRASASALVDTGVARRPPGPRGGRRAELRDRRGPGRSRIRTATSTARTSPGSSAAAGDRPAGAAAWRRVPSSDSYRVFGRGRARRRTSPSPRPSTPPSATGATSSTSASAAARPTRRARPPSRRPRRRA